SIIEVSDIEKVLDAIYKNYSVSSSPEVTIEANPDDISIPKLKEIKSTSINRFSVGIQSFHEKDLKFMNRAHDKSQADNCVPMIQDAGFDNITIDLIYGVPNQNEQEWIYNLDKAFELNVPHISAYALTVEEKTPLNKLIQSGKYPNVSDEKAFADFKVLMDMTKSNDFIQYEISNFGKEGYFSKHNSSYWKGEQYLGVGPSAHSYSGAERRWNLANNKLYLENLKSDKYFEKEVLSQQDVFNEYLMTGLRTIWGVSLKKISSEFNPSFIKYFLSKITILQTEGKININGDTVTISENNKFQTDGITSDLFIVN
ncbi:MAG: radical SAM family heme chaperone HemW, partial [Flavobacteriales bacterium]|nr:radical SAM family heme chaperone HemW [Flavobacteriales bacterium]